LTAHKRDGALIHLSSIPCLDGCEIGFARLVSRTGTPAVGSEEIRRRAKRVSGDVEIAGAVSQVMSTVSVSTTTPSTRITSSFVEEGLMLDMALEQQTRLRKVSRQPFQRKNNEGVEQKAIRSRNRNAQREASCL
jgi:hypothetical protein